MCHQVVLDMYGSEHWIFIADIISTVEFNHDGELLATGDKGGRVVIFQREQPVCFMNQS